jgi:hypothetical protein
VRRGGDHDRRGVAAHVRGRRRHARLRSRAQHRAADLPGGRRDRRLAAAGEPDRLALLRRRRALLRLEPRARLGDVRAGRPCRAAARRGGRGVAECLALPAGHLRHATAVVPALPDRPAAVRRLAGGRLAVGGGDRRADHGKRPGARRARRRAGRRHREPRRGRRGRGGGPGRLALDAARHPRGRGFPRRPLPPGGRRRAAPAQMVRAGRRDLRHELRGGRLRVHRRGRAAVAGPADHRRGVRDHPHRGGDRDPEVPPVRDRPGDQPRARLRRADRHAGRGLSGLRAGRAAGDRRRVTALGRGVDAGDGGALPPGARPDPGGCRPALLPPPLRRCAHARGVRLAPA